MSRSPIGDKLQALADGPLVSRYAAKRRGKVVSRGYAAPPGSGPEGETCKSCAHCGALRFSRRNVYKCGVYPRPSNGAATDIRLSWAACMFWKARAR